MKRRPFLWLGILLAIGLVLALAFPSSHYVLIGLLQNEAFYDGKPTEYWVSALKKRGYFGPEVPCDVGNILSRAGAAAVPVLVDMLQEEDEDVRVQALFALSAMRPGEAAAAVSTLENTLINEKAGLHLRLASWALVKANEEAAIRAFIGTLERGRTTRSRVLAATLLGNRGQRARAAVEALRVALGDEDLKVRGRAAQALWQIERQVDTKLLLTLAQDEESTLCVPPRYSMAVWKDLGPEAQAAVPGLLQALRSPDETIRLCATIALGHMGQTILAKEAVWALAARLKDGSLAVRRGAACALGRIGSKAGEAVPDLIEALKDKDEYTRSNAAEALGRVGPVTKAVIPGLMAALQDESVDVRRYAAYALGEIGLAQAQVP